MSSRMENCEKTWNTWNNWNKIASFQRFFNKIFNKGVIFTTDNEIWELARLRQPLPDTNSIADACLYYAARNIYTAFDNNLIGNAEAKIEKRKAINQYSRFKRGEDLAQEEIRARLKISALSIEAEKGGCDICKRMARIFDHRETS